MKGCLLHHVHLFCTDLEATVAFWRDGLGLPFIRYRPFGKDPGAEMDFGNGVLLSIVQRGTNKRDLSAFISGVDHLGMLVPDLDAALAHLVSLPGVRVTREPFMSEKLRCAFVAGPDDVQVELAEDTSRA